MYQVIRDIWNINWGMGENNKGRSLFGAHAVFFKENLRCITYFLENKKKSTRFERFLLT